VRIFERLGLKFRAVRADTGAIGGSLSHEFQVIADTGEDVLVYCPDSDYAANIELAEALPLIAVRPAPTLALQKVATPETSRCEDVAAVVAWLCSPGTAPINDRVFYIAGGHLAVFQQPELIRARFNADGWSLDSLLDPLKRILAKSRGLSRV
jgi:prolyl-tRNA synthetase